MTNAEPTVRLATSLDAIRPGDWDACAHLASGNDAKASGAGPDADDEIDPARGGERNTIDSATETPEGKAEPNPRASQEDDPHNPFLSHSFLSSLERSRSVGGRSGWSPAYLLVEQDGVLVGATPSYLKSHSQGEYVFDHGWADAFERAGGSYYPKLQVAVPFTPVTGRRLLVRPDAPPDTRDTVIAGLRALCRQVEASSVHITFPTEGEYAALGAQRWLQRTGQQFHWINEGYATFEDFLAALASRKRKAIRRERAEAVAPGIEIVPLTGSDLREEHWDAFYRFYMDTGSRKWGTPYLTRAFFSHLGQSMPERVLLVMARRAGQWIAGALNLIGDHALYGRNWGAIEQHPFLHFEICYYQAIDWAIAHGLRRVEAGAQGEHKLARGYRPVATYSAHHFDDPAMRRAVADYLRHERAHVDATIAMYEDHVPFKKG